MKLADSAFRPHLVSDIKCMPLFHNEKTDTYCIGSISRNKYIQIKADNIAAIERTTELMDGTNSINEIEDYMYNNYSVNINVLNLCKWFGKAGLFEEQPEDIRIEKQEMDYLSLTIAKVRLTKCYPVFDLLGIRYWKVLLFFSFLIVILGSTSLIFCWQELFHLSTYEINGSIILGSIFIIVLFAVSIGLHEFSHAIVGYACGLKPDEIVFSLYVGTPMFYVKMPGIYTLSPKKRILVWGAGIYANIIIAFLCMSLVPMTSGVIRNMFLITCSTNISLVIANLSPLLPLDGYFILSTILKKPNLRKGSFQQFKNWIFHKDNKFSGLYILYFIASMVFYIVLACYMIRWVINVIEYGIIHNYLWYEYLYEFRLFILILSVIFVKKGVQVIVDKIRRRMDIS